MALDTRVIREAIADRLREWCGLTAYPFDQRTSVYPRAIVLPGSPSVEYHRAMGDLVSLTYRVEVRTVAADPVSAQIALAEFVDAGTGKTRSVHDALLDVATGDTTPTLGGVVENVHIDTVELADGLELTEGQIEFTATFNVTVKTRRA